MPDSWHPNCRYFLDSFTAVQPHDYVLATGKRKWATSRSSPLKQQDVEDTIPGPSPLWTSKGERNQLLLWVSLTEELAQEAWMRSLSPSESPCSSLNALKGCSNVYKKAFHSILFCGKFFKNEITRTSKMIYAWVTGKTERTQKSKLASYRKSRGESLRWQPRPVFSFSRSLYF